MPISAAGVHVPAGLGEERRHVARRAVGRAVEERLAALGGARVEAAAPAASAPGSRADRTAAPAASSVIRSGSLSHVAEARARRDRELRRVVQPGIEEGALAVHLEIGDERVPVRHGAPAGVGVQVDAGEAERRRDQRRRGLAVRPERLAVEEQLGVELARSPAVRAPCAPSAWSRLQQVATALQVGRERDDRADVQVAIGPAVEPLADAGRERVVDGRMAQRAGRVRSTVPAPPGPGITPITAFASMSASVFAGSLRSTVAR